jgi:hypothetical protein
VLKHLRQLMMRQNGLNQCPRYVHSLSAHGGGGDLR